MCTVLWQKQDCHFRTYSATLGGGEVNVSAGLGRQHDLLEVDTQGAEAGSTLDCIRISLCQRPLRQDESLSSPVLQTCRAIERERGMDRSLQHATLNPEP